MQMDDFEPFPNLPLSFLDLADRATAQIERTGLTSDPDRMFELAMVSLGEVGAIDRMKLRSQGELIDPDTLRAHGLRANTKIGFGLLGMLER